MVDTTLFGIEFIAVRDLDPKNNKVIIRDLSKWLYTTETQLDQKEFNKFKFEFIKWLKQRVDPQDRVAEFEYRDEHGLPDWDKQERLIEKRKTRAEKERDLQDELLIMKLSKKAGVEYYGPLRREK